MEDLTASEDQIRERRAGLLIGTWDYLISTEYFCKLSLKLSMPLIEEIVEHYLDDLRIIRTRYRIKQCIQLHKVAGLTAAAIMRYRPVIPMTDSYNAPHEIYANETFAIIHGLALCGEQSLEIGERLGSEPWFDKWMNDFLYLLHRRNHTPESLGFIFQTLSTFVFPKNLETSNHCC